MNGNRRTPSLLRRRDVVELLGVSSFDLIKLARIGVLVPIRVHVSCRGYYRKEDLERVFKIKL